MFPRYKPQMFPKSQNLETKVCRGSMAFHCTWNLQNLQGDRVTKVKRPYSRTPNAPGFRTNMNEHFSEIYKTVEIDWGLLKHYCYQF